MKIINNFKIPEKYKKSAIAIGNFDGIHLGHQKVFKETKKIAIRLQKQKKPSPLMSYLNRKSKILLGLI